MTIFEDYVIIEYCYDRCKVAVSVTGREDIRMKIKSWIKIAVVAVLIVLVACLALNGIQIGKYIVTARQKDGKWYVGGLTNWEARDLTLQLDFLEKGRTYTATVMRDGVNADKNATDYIKETRTVGSNTQLDLHLASGGGFAIIIE